MAAGAHLQVVGESGEWRGVLRKATQVASTDTTVLVTGKSGTGKEVVARFIHAASARRRRPFIALNCAALPEQLLEAELFGYERGAFTVGTLSLLSLQDTLATSVATVSSELVRLYKALGGGWSGSEMLPVGRCAGWCNRRPKLLAIARSRDDPERRECANSRHAASSYRSVLRPSALGCGQHIGMLRLPIK